jgi:hypothetical protein
MLATLHWLDWRTAVELSVAVGLFGLVARATAQPRLKGVGAFARELAIVLALYAMWRIVGTISIAKVDGAVEAGHSIWHWERVMHFPNERTVQQAMLRYPWLVQTANAFYATVHIPAMMAFLPWLWYSHRDKYPSVRNVVALTTLWCLAIQLIPVAPPRLVPSLHILDTPALYHQTVYPAFGANGPAQLSAMPSVHVAWAVIIGTTIVVVAESPWRFLALLHPIITTLVVVGTGNHYWLDGVVGALIFVLALGFERSVRMFFVRRRMRNAAIDLTNQPDDEVAERSADADGQAKRMIETPPAIRQ